MTELTVFPTAKVEDLTLPPREVVVQEPPAPATIGNGSAAPLQARDEINERKQSLLDDPVGDGSISLSGNPVTRSHTGGWKAAPFFYVLIFADTISVLGIAGNLVTYIRGTLHMSVANAANTATNFMGFTYLLPIFWGFLADSYFGRFWIITFGSTLAFAGLVILTLSSTLSALRPTCVPTEENPACPAASGGTLAWFYVALGMISAGSAGLKPCMLTLGQDQFDERDNVEKKHGAKFYTGYYIFLNLYSMFCVTVLFYIQSSVSFSWGYGLITLLYLIGVSIFFLGTRRYRHRRPVGSTLTRAARVLVAAIKKWNKPLPTDPQDLYEYDDRKCQAEGIRKIVHTDRLRCLDKAAIVPERTDNEDIEDHQQQQTHLSSSISTDGGKWGLCTVTQVEELKAVLQILPIWVCLALVFTLYAQVMGVGVEQASTLDRRVGRLVIPPGTTAICLQIAAILFILVYEYFLVPPLAKVTGNPQGLSPLQKIGVSLIFAILAMVVGANVEDRRVRIIEEYAQGNLSILHEGEVVQVPMSVWWLVPQFVLLGWVEVVLGIAQLHFLHRETPDSMRNLAIAATFVTIALGYFVSSGLVSTVNHYTAATGGWLAGEFNTGGLKKYYYLLAIIMGINFLVFLILAHFYTYKRYEAPEPNVGAPAEPEAVFGRPLTTVSEDSEND